VRFPWLTLAFIFLLVAIFADGIWWGFFVVCAAGGVHNVLRGEQHG
jgi:hypothetical protein